VTRGVSNTLWSGARSPSEQTITLSKQQHFRPVPLTCMCSGSGTHLSHQSIQYSCCCPGGGSRAWNLLKEDANRPGTCRTHDTRGDESCARAVHTAQQGYAGLHAGVSSAGRSLGFKDQVNCNALQRTAVRHHVKSCGTEYCCVMLWPAASVMSTQLLVECKRHPDAASHLAVQQLVERVIKVNVSSTAGHNKVSLQGRQDTIHRPRVC
jgi:hypothetical protein